MQSDSKAKKYLANFLKIAPLSHALWRTPEALVFEGVKLKHPILDVGCGFGEFAGVVFNRLEVGIDINEPEIKRAMLGQKYKEVKLADARNLPFAPGSFSAVISVSVLEHIPNTEDAVKEISRVLKKGGKFVFTVPTDSLYESLLIPKVFKALNLEGLGKWYFRMHSGVFNHVSLRPDKWWDDQLKKNNFKILKKQGTVSPTVVKLHELFLPFAFPSQLWKWLFKRRLITSRGIRSKVLLPIFSRFASVDKDCTANIFYVAEKL